MADAGGNGKAVGYLFSEQQSIAIGDEYQDRKGGKQLHHIPGTRQFITSPGKKGMTTEPIKRLFEGEVYVERSKQRSAEFFAAKAKREKISEKNWTPSGNGKKLTTPGGYEGTFCKDPYEHMNDGTKSGAVRKSEEEWEASRPGRQILTSPAKKGHYNAPGILMEKEGKYLRADPEAWARYHKEQREKYAADERPAFKPVSFFTSQDANKIYERDEKCLPMKPDPTEGMTRREQAEHKVAKDDDRKPYCSVVRGSLGSYPEYMPRVPADDGKKKRRKGDAEDGPAPFIPNGKPKSGPTRSIAKMPYRVATIMRRR